VTLKRMSTTAPEADLRTKNPNTDGAQYYYKEPKWKSRRTKPEKKSRDRNHLHVLENETKLA